MIYGEGISFTMMASFEIPNRNITEIGPIIILYNKETSAWYFEWISTAIISNSICWIEWMIDTQMNDFETIAKKNP